MIDYKKVSKYTKELNILYVEDNESLREETSELFEEFFNTTITAFDGQNGIELYRQYKEDTNRYFDLVVTDINMPHKDGIEMIKDIRKINLEQSIIVISAYNDSDKIIQLIQLGIANFVMKPIKAPELLEMLYKTSKTIVNANNKEQLLLSQSKLASMGEMIDSIAHQWLQPLNIITMQSTILNLNNMKGKNTPQSISLYIEEQTKQIDYLVETLNEFRNFFRPNHDLELTTYKPQIESVLILLKDIVTANSITINLDINNSYQVELIINEFKHLLINIINNAIDAFKENNISPQMREIKISSYTEDDQAILSICDNAGGIPQNIINTIFEANITTKETGTGMGLYMSQQIIQKIDGTMSVSSEEDRTCFKISLSKKS